MADDNYDSFRNNLKNPPNSDGTVDAFKDLNTNKTGVPYYGTYSGWDKLTLSPFSQLDDNISSISSINFPGLARVSLKATWNYTLSRANMNGDGATQFLRSKCNGMQLRDVDIEIQISNEDEYHRMVNICNMIFGKIEETNLPRFYIIHPTTQICNLHIIQIKSMSFPMPNAKDGWTVKMACQEYFRFFSTRDTVGEADAKDPNQDRVRKKK